MYADLPFSPIAMQNYTRSRILYPHTLLLIAIQTSVPWNRRGVATATTIFFRTIGGTLAVGLLGGALSHSLSGAGVDAAFVDKLLGPERAHTRGVHLSRRFRVPSLLTR